MNPERRSALIDAATSGALLAMIWLLSALFVFPPLMLIFHEVKGRVSETMQGGIFVIMFFTFATLPFNFSYHLLLKVVMEKRVTALNTAAYCLCLVLAANAYAAATEDGFFDWVQHVEGFLLLIAGVIFCQSRLVDWLFDFLSGLKRLKPLS
jgi:hypothetical protein